MRALYWAIGGPAGVAHPALRNANWFVLNAVCGLWALIASAATWSLTRSRPTRLPRWVPMTHGWLGTGPLFAWSCWKLPLTLCVAIAHPADASLPENLTVAAFLYAAAAVAGAVSPQGHDVLTYLDAAPDPAPNRTPPAADERVIELRPAQMDALRVCTSLAPTLRVPPADGLVERVRTAYFDRPGNRWRMTLTTAQIDSVAYAFYLRALSGSVAEANWFAREYGVTYRVDPSTGRPGAVRPRARTALP